MKLIKILMFACMLFFIGITGCTHSQKSSSAVSPQDNTEIKYTCPMHPQIMEDHPGSCPICGMTLIKKTGQASEGAGISLSTVLQPVNGSVISSINIITPQQKKLPISIIAEGYLDFDTRTFNNIASRFSGRIEKLYIKYAFQEIHRSQRIFDIYSPDMVTAQQELIYLAKNSPHETSLINSARQKLLLLGITDSQLNQIVKSGKAIYSLPVYSPYQGHVHDVAHSQMPGAADIKPQQNFSTNLPLAIKEGMYVEKGQTIFNVVNPHQLWAILKVDRANLPALKLNQAVAITLPDVPDKIIEGKVGFIEPFIQSGDKNISIRVYIHNMDHSLKSKQFG